jgi:hypothetical protein
LNTPATALVSMSYRQRPYWYFVAAFLFACAGDTGGDAGCGGCGDGCGAPAEGAAAYEFEGTIDEHVVMQGAQVHVSQRGFDFLAGNLGGLVGGVLGGGEESEGTSIDICLPENDNLALGIGLCDDGRLCDDGTAGCQLSIEFACRPCSVSSDCPDSAFCDGGVCQPTGGGECIPDITLEAVPGEPSDLLRATISLSLNEVLRTTSLIEDCDLTLSTSAEGLPVTANVYFDVGGAPWERVSIRVPADEIDLNLESLDIDLDDGFLCAIGNGFISVLRSALNGLISGFIADPLNAAVEPLLCVACDAETLCPVASTCDDAGICRIDGGGGACAPIALGIETEVALGDLLAAFAPGIEADLGVLAYLANYADSNGPVDADLDYYGLDLALQAGFFAGQDACVPFVPPPSTTRVPKSDELNAALTPAGEEFAIGIGISRSALDLAGWAAFRSGVLCLQVDSSLASQISTGTFALLIPSLGELAQGDNRPMYIELRPQEPPNFVFGAGTVDEDGNILDPLITLRIDNLDLDFYAVVEDRFTRVLTLNVDVAVPLALDVNETGQIVVVLGDLANAIERVEASNAQLLAAADVEQVAVLLPGLISAVLPALGGDLIPPIDIPAFSGISIAIPSGGFTSVDENEMLAIFADFIIEVSAEKSGDGAVFVRGHRVVFPHDQASLLEMRALGVVALEALTPAVEIDAVVTGFARVAALEWSYRVGETLWSTWRPGEPDLIQDPRFLLDGAFDVELRVREAGAPRTAASTHLDVVVDRTPPSLSVALNMDRLQIESDGALRVRFDDGDWRRIETTELVAPPGATRVQIETTDEVGNMRTATLALETPSADRTALPASRTPSPDAQAGCSAGTTGGASFAWLALLGLVGLGLRRNRARWVSLMAAMVLLSACNDKRGSGDECGCEEGLVCDDAGACVAPPCESDEMCEGTLVCEDGDCVPGPCVDDSECGETEICEGGVCVDGCRDDEGCVDAEVCIEGMCEPACDVSACECEVGEVAACADNACICEPACGGDCGDGEGCCYDSQQCVDVSAECAVEACEPGFEALPVADPMWDPTTCEASVECACTELPPLPFGEHGEYLDLGVSPNGAVTAVATYNREYGDLVVGTISGTEIAWSFVAGVPSDGSVVGSTAGPRGGVRSDGDDVGRYASVAAADDGTLHVAYFQRNGDSPRSLGYALGTLIDGEYVWTTMVLDDGDEAGWFTDIVLAENGAPVIFYVAPRVQAEDDVNIATEVRVVRAQTTTPAGSEDFTVPVAVFSIPLTQPCGDACGGRTVCRGDLNVCQRSTDNDDCGGCAEADACFENEDGTTACAAFAEPSALDEVPRIGALYVDAERISGASVGVAFYDRSRGNLLYGVVDADALTGGVLEVIDGEGLDEDSGEQIDTGDVGAFPDLVLDPAGERWIAYADLGTGALRVAALGAGTISVVDEGLRCYEQDPSDPLRCLQPVVSRVGADASLVVTADGAWITFQDATFHEVLESPAFAGGWDVGGVIAGGGTPVTGALGFHSAQAVDDEGRLVVTQRIDARAEPRVVDVVVIRP